MLLLYVYVQILRSAGTRWRKRNPKESPCKESKRNQKIYSRCDIGRDQERGTISEKKATEQRITSHDIDTIHTGKDHISVIIAALSCDWKND